MVFGYCIIKYYVLDIQGELQSYYELEKIIMGREMLPI